MIKNVPSIEQLSKLIRMRRSVFPKEYIDREIKEADILTILENGNWAPTHRKTEPWRFKVVQGKRKLDLGNYLSNKYRENTPKEVFKQAKAEGIIHKAVRSNTIIGICMHYTEESAQPEWEEIAAVSCAVQNMWLSCVALGIGCYWSSPETIVKDKTFFQLGPEERCLGLFYMGYWEQRKIKAIRGNIKDKIEWIR